MGASTALKEHTPGSCARGGVSGERENRSSPAPCPSLKALGCWAALRHQGVVPRASLTPASPSTAQSQPQVLTGTPAVCLLVCKPLPRLSPSPGPRPTPP
eukprot:scaffold1375_cov96-Isochrysis_galbana.AAC.11